MKNKMKAMAIVALLATTAYAAKTDVRVIELSNAKPEETVALRVDTYRTEYKSEFVQRTCSNQVCSGTVQECHTESTPQSCYSVPSSGSCHEDRSCEIINGQRECTVSTVCSGGGYEEVCSGGGYQEVCSSVPNCHLEYYDCSGYENVPYEVLDHKTEANVRVVMKDIAPGLTLKEKFNVNLVGDSVQVTTQLTKSNALILGVLSQKDGMVGGVNKIDAVMTMKAISLVEATALLTGGMKAVEIVNGILTIETKVGTKNPELFSLDISVINRKAAGEPVVASGNLSLLNAKPVAMGSKVRWQIDLKDIGLEWTQLPSGKYKAEIILGSSLDSSKIINPGSVPQLSPDEDSVKFEIK